MPTIITLYGLIQYSASSLVGHIGYPNAADLEVMSFRCLEKVIPERLRRFPGMRCERSPVRDMTEPLPYLWESIGMSSYNGDGILSRFRSSTRHILLDGQLKDGLLPRSGRIWVPRYSRMCWPGRVCSMIWNFPDIVEGQPTDNCSSI